MWLNFYKFITILIIIILLIIWRQYLRFYLFNIDYSDLFFFVTIIKLYFFKSAHLLNFDFFAEISIFVLWKLIIFTIMLSLLLNIYLSSHKFHNVKIGLNSEILVFNLQNSYSYLSFIFLVSFDSATWSDLWFNDLSVALYG